jgi:hypothetical protein
MRVVGSNRRTRAFLLGEVAAEVRILDLGEEFVMVCFGDWSLGRCEVALLGEEAWLRDVNLGRRSFRYMWPGSTTTRRTRGR